MAEEEHIHGSQDNRFIRSVTEHRFHKGLITEKSYLQFICIDDGVVYGEIEIIEPEDK